MNDTNFTTIMATELYDSADNPDNPISEIAEGETVKVLQVNLGVRFQYCQVEYQEKKYFMRAAFLDPVDDLFLADYKEKYDSSLDESEERIGDIKVGVPYRKNNKIHIVIETGYFDKKELEDNLKLKNLENIKAQAADEILEYYGKNINAEDYEEKLLEFILSPFGLLEVGDFNYSTRPGKSIKIKFSIHEKYFDVFQDMSMEDFRINNIGTNFVTTNFRANELEKIIKDMSKILDKFDKASPNLAGTLEGVNFKQLSAKSKRFLADFKKYAYENDIVITKDLNNKFELGFDKETGVLKYVLYFDPVGRFLKIGMSYLCKIFDTDISRMIQDHKNILKSINCGLNPIDFGKKYIKSLNFNLGLPPKNPKKNVVSEPETSVLPVKEAIDLNDSTRHPPTRRELTDRLRNSRDLIGDGFLIDLPEIIMNIGDLNLLFELVLNKVSIKDLVDFLIGSLGTNLSLPELGEIKLRGILQSLSLPQLLDVMFEFLELPELPDFGGTICDKYFFAKKEFGSLINSLESIDNIGVYFIHYKEDGTLGGLIPENHVGDVQEILKNNDITDCSKLVYAIASAQIDFNQFYQEEMVAKILCQILTEGLPSFGEINECFNIPSLPSVSLGSIKIDLFDFFGTLDPSLLKPAIDIYFKERFKNPPSDESTGEPTDESNVLRQRLLSIPSVSFSLCDLELTNEKLLKRVDGIDLDFETKKIDSQFTFPSLEDINPSFDFTKFQFKNLDDIFEIPMTAVEDAIKSGIEQSLLVSIRGVLNRVLDGLNGDLSELEEPDFGSLNMPDLFNASNGTNFDFAVDIALKRLQLSKKAKLASLCDGVIELADPKREDVENMFEDISDSAKPLEVIRILKGQVNEKDYDNLGSNLSEPIASILDGSVFVDIFESLTEIVDFDMLDELEKTYDNEEVFASLCETKNISYKTGKTLNDNYGNIKNKLRENYNNVTEDELDDIVEDLIDDVKDSMVEAISIIKDNYNSILPFDEDPCSFMPPQSSIPAMNFVNNLMFDNIFDVIEKQYKSEASTLQDAFLVSTKSDEYVKMRNFPFDAALTGFEEKDDGTFEPQFDTLFNIDSSLFPDDDSTIFNKEFGFNYFGEGTELYELKNDQYKLLQGDKIPTLKSIDDEWDFRDAKELKNVYVRKQNPVLVPVPTYRSEFKKRPRSFVSSSFGNKITIKTAIQSIIKDENVEVQYVLEPPNENKFIIEQFDAKSGEFFDCIEKLDIESMPSSYPDIISLFEDHTLLVAKQSKDSEYKYGKFKSVLNSIEDDVTSEISSSPLLVDKSKDVIPTLFYKLSTMSAKLLRRNNDGTTDSDLFELGNMLSFVIDNDTIDLLNIQDAKNAAKQDFNSSCSFAEDDKSLENASIKQLVSTMIRVQMIEEIVKNAFFNSNAYDSEATNAFITIVWAKLNLYLKSQEDAFLEKFSEKYLEVYGEEFTINSSASSKTVKEIYSDISRNFDKIFMKSEDFLLKLAREFSYDTEFEPHDLESYISGFDEVYKNNVFSNFFVQRVYRNENKEEIYYFDYNNLSAEEKSDYKLFLRLSYIMGVGQDKEMEWDFTGEYGTRRELIVNDTFYKLKNSISHEYLINYNLAYSQASVFLGDYYLLPLAEMRAEYSTDESISGTLDGLFALYGTKEEISKVLISNTGSGIDIYNFLMNVMRVDHLKQTIVELYKTLLIAEKPEISLIFAETKNIIKRNIEILSQDRQDPTAFQSQNKQMDSLVLEQQSGISTMPEYSAIASKMALMTVPLILKGFAEQFDPNIKIASIIRKGASLAGFDIAPVAASLMALPMNLIPLAPGPPIGPLGLLYLASSFLEPKERKKLADLKRGDNLNTSENVDPDTGSFIGGTLEEIAEEAEQQAIDDAQEVIERYEEFMRNISEFLDEAITALNIYEAAYNLVSEGSTDPSILIDLPNAARPNFSGVPGYFPVFESFNDYGGSARISILGGSFDLSEVGIDIDDSELAKIPIWKIMFYLGFLNKSYAINGQMGLTLTEFLDYLGNLVLYSNRGANYKAYAWDRLLDPSLSQFADGVNIYNAVAESSFIFLVLQAELLFNIYELIDREVPQDIQEVKQAFNSNNKSYKNLRRELQSTYSIYAIQQGSTAPYAQAKYLDFKTLYEEKVKPFNWHTHYIELFGVDPLSSEGSYTEEDFEELASDALKDIEKSRNQAIRTLNQNT